jgi:uncharacterized protein
MAYGISYRSILVVTILILSSCSDTGDEETPIQITAAAPKDTTKNIKENFGSQQNDSTALTLSAAEKTAMARDEQMLRQHRVIVRNNFPKPANWVNDFDNLFTEQQEDDLNSIISGFEKKSGMQIAVVTLDSFSVSKDDASGIGLKIFNAWGVGTKKKNDGLLITIINNYGYMRINTGTGTQQILNDQSADSIMRAAFFPSFAKGELYKGTLTGVNALISYLQPRAALIK